MERPVSRVFLDWRWRLWSILAGVCCPIASFAFAMIGGPLGVDSPWQSGRMRDYAVLLLSPYPLMAVMPLVSVSAWILMMVALWPETRRRTWVEVGIWGGCVLSTLYYWICLTVEPGYFMVSLMSAGCVWLVYRIGWWLSPRGRQIGISRLLIWMLAAAVFSAVMMAFYRGSEEELDGIWLLGMVFSVGGTLAISGPLLAMLQFWIVAAALSREWSDWEHRLAWVWWPSWGVAFLVSWRQGLVWMLEEYANLPTTDPNCFVSAAAAQGHGWLVGSRWVEVGVQGKRVAVTGQMCHLKFFELVLRRLSPRLHGWVRRVYNRLGPILAGWCRRSRWGGDMAYASLKPLEWVAEGMRIAIGVPRSAVERLYGYREGSRRED